MPTFGQRLKELRLQKSLTQKDIADYLKITVTAYQNYEYDKREMGITSLTILSHYFNVSVDYLIGLSDNPQRY